MRPTNPPNLPHHPPRGLPAQRRVECLVLRRGCGERNVVLLLPPVVLVGGEGRREGREGRE